MLTGLLTAVQSHAMLRKVLDPVFLLKCLALFLAYYVCAEAAYSFYAPPAVFPLSAGIALAGLVVWGLEFAPVIFIAAFASLFMHGASPVIATAVAAGN